MAVRVSSTPGLLARDATLEQRRHVSPPLAIGRAAIVVAWTGIGLAVCTGATMLSRATLAPTPLIFFAGLLIIGVPIFIRLASRDASVGERLALVCLLGLALYGVKLAREPMLYASWDEIIHASNAEQITSHHHLFQANSVLPITEHFPGLDGTASALMTMTGISSFGAGILIIGAARLALVIAMFLLFLRISGSARTAGLGVALYETNLNFLDWSAEFSYESLALPLLVVVLMALAERDAAPRSWWWAWAFPIVLGTAAVVVTHHLTSYLLAASLIALALLYWVLHRRVLWPNPWPIAVVALTLAGAWFVLVAGSTADYLSPVLSNAFSAVWGVISNGAPSRGLFNSQASATESTPVIARIIALGSMAILAAGLPFGLRHVWRSQRMQPFALLFGAAAIGFFVTLAFRFTPVAWETGARATGFLFIGVAFILASARFEDRGTAAAPWLGRALVVTCLGVVLIGGAISGVPWDVQLPKPLRAEAEGRTIEAEPLGMARWVSSSLPDRRFAAPPADALFLLEPGGVTPIDPNDRYVDRILRERRLGSWELPLLRYHRVRYVVADRRRRSFDNVRGFYFSLRPPAGPRDRLLPKESVDKFERLPAARVFDSGNIAVYDIRGRR